MTQEQFYFCLDQILELRSRIKDTYTVRRKAQVIEATLAEEEQVSFDALKQFKENKESADKNTLESLSLLKKLAVQEASIRAYVPVSLYGKTIKATYQNLPVIYVTIDIQSIAIEKGTL